MYDSDWKDPKAVNAIQGTVHCADPMQKVSVFFTANLEIVFYLFIYLFIFI